MTAGSPVPDPAVRAVRPNTCSGCDATWTGVAVAHCSAKNCHRTFSGPGLFDLHRSEGRCLDPDQVLTRGGERRLFFRDGQWRGPEATEEQRAKLRGIAS